jgi:hypothetical protein
MRRGLGRRYVDLFISTRISGEGGERREEKRMGRGWDFGFKMTMEYGNTATRLSLSALLPYSSLLHFPGTLHPTSHTY